MSTRHLSSTAEISLHRKLQRLRVIGVQIYRLDRRVKALTICSQPTKAAKVVTSESRAQADFAKHLKLQGSTNTTEAATRLLQQAVVSRKIPPYVALGAALHVEQQCKNNTGVMQ